MPTQHQVDWRTVVEQIRTGDPAGEESLYANLASGARIFLQRRIGIQDVEDRVHDLFLIVVETIRRGELREPERLMGFVRTVLNRQLNLSITQIVRSRDNLVTLESAHHLTMAEPTPEQQAAIRERIDLMKQVLTEMSDRDFDVLTRFYIREQPAERIRQDMSLTQTQFDLLKSRAKARLLELVRKRMARRAISPQ